MQILHWQFKPGLWPTIACLVFFPLLVSLGIWQLDRAAQKQSMETTYGLRSSETAIDLNQAESGIRQNAEQMQWRQTMVHGSFDTNNILLLDNQVMRGQAGYFIFIPLMLTDDQTRVLVNYGWVPVGLDRAKAPEMTLPEGEIELQGVAKTAPATGIKLAPVGMEKLTGPYYRVQEINLPVLAEEKGWRLLPYVLRLQAPAPQGILREWTKPGFGREKHLGYAFQWFLLAATLLIIYIVLNVKKRHE